MVRKTRQQASAAQSGRQAPVASVGQQAPAAPVGQQAPGAPVGQQAPAAPVGRQASASPVGQKAPATTVGQQASAAPVDQQGPHVKVAPQPPSPMQGILIYCAKPEAKPCPNILQAVAVVRLARIRLRRIKRDIGSILIEPLCFNGNVYVYAGLEMRITRVGDRLTRKRKATALAGEMTAGPVADPVGGVTPAAAGAVGGATPAAAGAVGGVTPAAAGAVGGVTPAAAPVPGEGVKLGPGPRDPDSLRAVNNNKAQFWI